MAIVFTCPHCQELYRLKDELAGKQAKCKNPDCRQLITIPHPVTVPDDALEAAALAALVEEAKQDQPQGEKVIPMTCSYCAHEWTEPLAKAGKNVLCPNPDCRQRMRVPEPKDDQSQDWRQTRTKLPSGAKEAQQKLEGVQATADTKMVSGEAIRQAGLIEVEYEPRPLKQKVMLGALAVGFLAAVVFGIWYWMRTGTQKEEDRLMADARIEFDEKAAELSPAEAGLFSAVLNTAAAEHALRQNKPEKLTTAHELLGKARDDLNKPATLAPAAIPTRNAVLGEVALLVVSFGGNEDQVNDQTRLRWQPEVGNNRMPRVNERTPAVHTELRQTLTRLKDAADFEFKLILARRLTRELVRHGQATLAGDLIPLALFNDSEKDEARAVIALEIYRADPAAAYPRQMADELKALPAGGPKAGPVPVSAHTLFTVLGIERKPPLVAAPPPSGPVDPVSAFAYVGVRLLEGKPDEAVQLAQRSRTPESQIKALLLCAEWSDPGPAVDAAAAVVTSVRGKTSVRPSQAHLLRLVQLAAAAGRQDHAKTFADALTDDGLRAWAAGEMVRQRVVAGAKEKADETWVEVPTTSEKLHVGHAWGRLWVARQNAKLSGDRSGEVQATAGWTPAPVHPFALAGIALGLQDR